MNRVPAGVTRSGLRQAGLVLFFVLLACLMVYWPLMHATTHVPGRYTTDYFHFHWNMWWIRHALEDPGASVYETNYVLFPFTSNLGYHTLTPFWFPLWAVLEPPLGTLAAFEVFFVIGLALTGACFYAWLRHEGLSPGWAVIGGAALELSPVLAYFVSWSMMDLICWFWIPVHLLAWSRIARRAHHPWHGWMMAFGLGVLFWLTGLADPQYFLYGAPLLVPYGLLTVIRVKGGQGRTRLVAMGLLAVAVGAVLLWFAGPLAAMSKGLDPDRLVPAPVENAPSLRFPDDFLNLTPDVMTDAVPGAYLLPLLVVSLLVYLTPLRRRIRAGQDRRWFWLALAPLPWLMSLGPSITVLGQPITLPYRLLYESTGGLLRFPFRFGPAFIMPVLLFVTLTWQNLITAPAVRRAVLAGALPALLISTHALHPMDIWPAPPVYDFYRTMGAEDDDYVVVEVPVAAGTGELWIGDFADIETQFYGTVHGKRMVNGFVSRTPLEYYWYLRDSDPMLSWLGQRRLLDPAAVEAQLRERIFGWPVGYIVIHQDRIGLHGPTNQEIISYFNSLPGLLCPFAVEGPAVAYRTTWHPAGCPARTPPEVRPGVFRIDVGSPDDVRYLGGGWHWSEQVFDISLRWAGHEPQASLFVDLPPGAYTVTLAAQAFWQDRSVQLQVNGEPAGEPVTVGTGGLAALSFDVPAGLVGDGRHVEFTLVYDGWTVPAEAGQSADPRPLAVAVDWVEFARQ